ncbi:EcsC family protein [Planococcus sp. APC 3900]|uniref:EcsC family protein n=1 Tax=Planococcus sp. APC 3900 TaxID=3035191 RepID=UPI0025B310BF|nr:EcsC family protein [Planococcus sp. APC 3900]MDN3436492.1 EcsC family protein [Planococcus sp. APC 3900]
MTLNQQDDKPAILKAVEIIIASPESIQKQVQQMEAKYNKKYSKKMTEDQIKDKVADHIISNYSYYTAFAGGTSALPGVIPGIGTAVAMVGGAASDAALTMKWEIEMVMSLATVYGVDITIDEEQRLCYLVAAFGVMNEAAKKGVAGFGAQSLKKMVQQYLKGPTLVAVKAAFKKVGVTFTRKALEKGIPFGVGVVVGTSSNKVLTLYVGKKAKDFFKTREFEVDGDDPIPA